jgi:hypothetical protein
LCRRTRGGCPTSTTRWSTSSSSTADVLSRTRGDCLDRGNGGIGEGCRLQFVARILREREAQRAGSQEKESTSHGGTSNSRSYHN